MQETEKEQDRQKRIKSLLLHQDEENGSHTVLVQFSDCHEVFCVGTLVARLGWKARTSCYGNHAVIKEKTIVLPLVMGSNCRIPTALLLLDRGEK